MGKILFRLAVLVSILVSIVLVIGSFLPRSFAIETSIDVAAAPAVVFEMVNTLPNWQHWSTFSKQRVDELEISYGGEISGVGAVQKWTDSRGDGKMWITSSEPMKSIEYDLKFGEFPIMNSQIKLTEVNNNTRLTWSSTGRLPPGPFYGFFALLFPRQMTYEYEQSLERLKSFVESENSPID